MAQLFSMPILLLASMPSLPWGGPHISIDRNAYTWHDTAHIDLHLEVAEPTYYHVALEVLSDGVWYDIDMDINADVEKGVIWSRLPKGGQWHLNYPLAKLDGLVGLDNGRFRFTLHYSTRPGSLDASVVSETFEVVRR